MRERKSIFSYDVNTSVEQLRIARLFLSCDKPCERWLFGRNEQSLALSRILDINGFVDDFADLRTWHGKPVRKAEEVPDEAIVINCVINAKPRTAQKRVAEMHVSGALAYMDLHNVAPEVVPLPEFILLSRSEFSLNYKKLIRVYDSLADDASRRVFRDVWRYRLSGDIRLLDDYTFRPWDQYFENFLCLRPGEIFVDVGGFDGDTTEQFCSRYSDYQKVYLFEPSKPNFDKARERLRHFDRIEFIQEGVSDSVGVLKFNPDAGSASNVSTSGTSTINVTTIDHRIDGEVTCIKMDIEGWELKALTGASEHIEKYRPVLAVATYHVPSHFWQIVELVTAIAENYDVYLRHYTESWTETVMYFIPNRSTAIIPS